MNFIKKGNYRKENHFIPEKTGIFIFYKEEEPLYISKSSNLRQSINSLFRKSAHDKNIFKLISLTDAISWETTSTLFSSLVEEKKFLSKQRPEFNLQIKPFADYVYLGIDFQHVPYFKIENDTRGDRFYLGPFRNRYFLYDFLDTMSELFRYPACENEEFPCWRLKKKICDGFCVQDSAVITKIIMENYLQPNEKIVVELSEKAENLASDLQFEKAELLKKQTNILSRYYRILKFLFVCKNLTLHFEENEKTFHIKDGLLEKIEMSEQIYEFPIFTPEYRSNELLAIEKSQLDEMWIIFQHLYKKDSKEIDRIFAKSISKFKNSILS